MGRVADPGATSADNCTSAPLYVGCFEDRESQADGRDLHHARFSMAANASVDHCAQLCAGYNFIGLQYIDQCFCSNSYGSYAQLTRGESGHRLEGQSVFAARTTVAWTMMLHGP